MPIPQLEVEAGAFEAAGLIAPIPAGADFNPEDYLRCGALHVEDLKDGGVYLGFSRRANMCRWDASKNAFEKITAEGECEEYPLNHFSNFDGTDVFIPIKVFEKQ